MTINFFYTCNLFCLEMTYAFTSDSWRWSKYWIIWCGGRTNDLVDSVLLGSTRRYDVAGIVPRVIKSVSLMEHRYKWTVRPNASGLLGSLPDKSVLNPALGNCVRRYFSAGNISTNVEPTIRHSQIVCLARRATLELSAICTGYR